MATEDDSSFNFMGAMGLCQGDMDCSKAPETSMPPSPCIGMTFDSWEDGEEFYKAYAERVGFSVRTWTQLKGGDGALLWKRYVCTREGFRKGNKRVITGANKPKRNRKLTRCGCEAMIGFKRNADGKYEVARFVESHTHELLSASQRQLIKSSREGLNYVPDCDDRLKPLSGMTFNSWEEGEKLYKVYADHVGFSVRTSTQSKDCGGVALWKRYVCTREGFRKGKQLEVTGENKRKRNRKLTRCGCEAMIAFKRKANGTYEVARFIEAHRHELVRPSKKRSEKSNREVSSEMKGTLLGTPEIFNLLNSEKGEQRNIGCTNVDLQNQRCGIQKAIKESDCQVFINIMKKKQSFNSEFFFDYQLDEKGMVKHIFWADGSCRKNYTLFGDVISFYSTCDTNQHGPIITLFTGVNHHNTCVTFGAGYLADNRIQSCTWLCQAFLKAMGGVAPKVVITNEDPSMECAIRDVFQTTKHRLCTWKILMKLSDKVGPMLNSNTQFSNRIRACVLGSETPEEFELKWSSIISEFGLENNAWLTEKYNMRQTWIPAYFHDLSLGRILQTTSRLESENAFFGHFNNQQPVLLEFWVRFQTAVEEQQRTELCNDNATLCMLPMLQSPWSIESHGREVYTNEIFKLFQDEVIAARDSCDVKSMAQLGEIRITGISDDSGKIKTVQYNTCTKIAQCSCRLFESVGIPCSHIIVVLKGEKCNEIPSHYIMQRWTKMATWINIFGSNMHMLEGSRTSLPPTITRLYSESCSKFNSGIDVAKQCEKKMRYLHKAISDAVDHVMQMGPISEYNGRQV